MVDTHLLSGEKAVAVVLPPCRMTSMSKFLLGFMMTAALEVASDIKLRVWS